MQEVDQPLIDDSAFRTFEPRCTLQIAVAFCESSYVRRVAAVIRDAVGDDLAVRHPLQGIRAVEDNLVLHREIVNGNIEAFGDDIEQFLPSFPGNPG